MAPSRKRTPDADRRVRIALSRAEHHRRRRRLAAGALAGTLLVAIAIAAVSFGSPGAWDPAGLRDEAAGEAPKLRLAEQASRAAAVIERQKAQRVRERAAVERTLAQTPFISRAGEQTKSVALTFDDGPSAYTDGILDTLRRYRAKATFFTLGSQLGKFPLQLQRIVADGHEVANHSYSHADLAKLSARDAAAELDGDSNGLVAAGLPRPTLFRPPYGAYTARTLSLAAKRKMLTVLWTIDTGDYEASDPNAIAQQVLEQIRPGAIVLMHDGGGNRTVTSQALPIMVRGLRKSGYEMVTLPQLLIRNPPAAEQGSVGRSEVA